jgi:hypothetical protein
MAASPGIAKPSSAHGRETEARLRIGGGVRTILLLPQQHLCDYARGERPEYRQVARAAVGLESLGRRQFSFIGPPEPMLFYKLPSLFHLTPPLQQRGPCLSRFQPSRSRTLEEGLVRSQLRPSLRK